jgi:hypothetical protein
MMKMEWFLIKKKKMVKCNLIFKGGGILIVKWVVKIKKIKKI